MKIRRRSPNPTIAVDQLRYQVKVPNSEPQHILEEIVWHKEGEVDRLREQTSLPELQKQVAQVAPPLDFLAALQQSPNQPALIAEVKKASPSKGLIRADFDPVAIAQAYERGGAACLSVLTDSKFFQGSFDYLAQIRQAVALPLLCKDFVLYPYQMYLARSKGADAVLLIAAILPDKDLTYFIKIARKLGMTPLVEVHTQAEMERVLRIEGVQLIGINNRNLQDFSVSLETTQTLLAANQALIADRGDLLFVSESGLYTASDLAIVQQAGARAVLIGESLMRQADVAIAVQTLYQS